MKYSGEVWYALEEVNRLDNSTKFKAFETLDVSEKKYCLLLKFCTVTVKTVQTPKYWGKGRLLGRLLRPKAESGSGVWGGSNKPPSHQLGSLRSVVSSQQGLGQRGPDRPKVSTILGTQDGLRSHYNIVNNFVDLKKMKTSYPIQS